jgi:hypothetical protein
MDFIVAIMRSQRWLDHNHCDPRAHGYPLDGEGGGTATATIGADEVRKALSLKISSSRPRSQAGAAARSLERIATIRRASSTKISNCSAERTFQKGEV